MACSIDSRHWWALVFTSLLVTTAEAGPPPGPDPMPTVESVNLTPETVDITGRNAESNSPIDTYWVVFLAGDWQAAFDGLVDAVRDGFDDLRLAAEGRTSSNQRSDGPERRGESAMR